MHMLVNAYAHMCICVYDVCIYVHMSSLWEADLFAQSTKRGSKNMYICKVGWCIAPSIQCVNEYVYTYACVHEVVGTCLTLLLDCSVCMFVYMCNSFPS